MSLSWGECGSPGDRDAARGGASGGHAGQQTERDGGCAGRWRRGGDARPNILTATRTTTTQAPAALAVRQALRESARQVASGQRDLEVLP